MIAQWGVILTSDVVFLALTLHWDLVTLEVRFSIVVLGDVYREAERVNA
jgi:hypothetical protein